MKKLHEYIQANSQRVPHGEGVDLVFFSVKAGPEANPEALREAMREKKGDCYSLENPTASDVIKRLELCIANEGMGQRELSHLLASSDEESLK